MENYMGIPFAHGVAKFGRCIFLLASGCWLAGVMPAAPAAIRPETSLNESWRFHYGPLAGAERKDYDDAAWSTVTLPHTWNAQDGADGGGDYARGGAWYRKRFRVETASSGRRVYLQFDGASRTATVFLNGQRVGEHEGGFARFRFDVTDALEAGGENVLAVMVSNETDGLAPMSADFTFFGGLYRGVKLFTTAPLHIDVLDHASDGVYLKQESVSAATAFRSRRYLKTTGTRGSR
jgi:beta-galactosidase